LLGLRPRALTVAAWAPATVLTPLVSRELPAVGSPTTTVAALAVDVRDQRRRAVFLLDRQGRDEGEVVVKVARSPGEEDRATHEQRVLSLLPRSPVTPLPLGAGRAGPIAWSAETGLSGRSLRQVLGRPGSGPPSILDRLSDWLGDVAVRTATSVDWASLAGSDQVIALRRRAIGLATMLQDLDGVPSVLSHGDLASGHNVLVDSDGQPAVLDWETARERGLPLLDLVPLLCCSLARVRGGHGVERQAGYILELARGRAAESDWLFSRVAAYASRLGLPGETVGSLALLAWGHQASMRLVRDELLHRAGLPVRPWTSVGELVLDAWWDEVGTTWAGPIRHLA
jgi:hypothetical protein